MIINELAQSARDTLTRSYTMVIRDEVEQYYMGDINDVTLDQAMSVFERNKQTMIDNEPTGFTIELLNLNGVIASHTNA